MSLVLPTAIAPLDILFVLPSRDWQTDKARMQAARIDPSIPNQEAPHIGIGYLMASARRYGIRAKYIDMTLDGYSIEAVVDYVKQARPTIVAFTAFTIHVKAAGEIAARIKQEVPRTVIGVGGPHASAIPHDTLAEFPDFDFVMMGEGERVLPTIMEAAGDLDRIGRVRGVVVRGKTDVRNEWVEDIECLDMPAWEDFNLENYGGLYPHRTRRELPMLAARGCPYQCNFCCRASGETVRQRSVASVIAEIERNIEQFGCESIAFNDETFALNKKWSAEFFATMKARGLNKKISWACSTRVSNTTPELFQAMREAGCYYVFFGLESADESVLKNIGKKTSTDAMRKSVSWAKQAGIVPVGAFIIGLPQDNEERVQMAIDLAADLDLFSVTFPIAVPFPGTSLRDTALRGEFGMRVLSNDWDHYGKQDAKVMESDDLSWEKRRELQQRAYARHPKKNLDEYIARLGRG